MSRTSIHPIQSSLDILQVVRTARARNKLLVVEADGTVRVGSFKDKVVHWLNNRNLDAHAKAKQMDNPDWRVADALAERLRDEFGPLNDDAAIRRWQLFKAEVEAITDDVPYSRDQIWRLPVEQLTAYLETFSSINPEEFQTRADERYAAKQQRVVTQTLREVDGNPHLHQSDFEQISAKAEPGKSSRKFDAEQRVVSTLQILEKHIASLRKRTPLDAETTQNIAHYEAHQLGLNRRLEEARAVNRSERLGLPDSTDEKTEPPSRTQKSVHFNSVEDVVPEPSIEDVSGLKASRKEMPRKVQNFAWNVPLQLRPASSSIGTKSAGPHAAEDFDSYQISQRPSGRRSAKEAQAFNEGYWASLPNEKGQAGPSSQLKPGGVNSSVVHLHERSVSNAAREIYQPYLKALSSIGAIKSPKRLVVQTPHDYSATARLAQFVKRLKDVFFGINSKSQTMPDPLGDACIDLDDALSDYSTLMLALDLTQSSPKQFQDALSALQTAQKRLDDFHEALLQATDPAVHRELRTHHRMVMQCIGADANMLTLHVTQAQASAEPSNDIASQPKAETTPILSASLSVPSEESEANSPGKSELRPLGRQRPYVAEVTVSSNVQNGQFYHESQRMMYCGMHALNAMLGGHFINENDIEQADRTQDEIDRLASGQMGSNALAQMAAKLMHLMSRVSTRGTDIMVLLDVLRLRLPEIWNSVEYANCTNRQALISQQEAVLQIINLRNLRVQEQETDRMVFGNDAHWFAFRKDDEGQWWRLDSLIPNPVPESPSEFAATHVRVGNNDQSNLIGGFYLNPWPSF